MHHSFVHLEISVHIQYFYMLALCSAEFLAFHIGVRLSATLFGHGLSLKDNNHISMALILSSFGKILLLIMVIWDYGNLDPSFLINIFVLCSNVCAIKGITDLMNRNAAARLSAISTYDTYGDYRQDSSTISCIIHAASLWRNFVSILTCYIWS